MIQSKKFDEQKTIHNLKHYLPAQAPLKDFIHHNTLHAFQEKSFHEALHTASDFFGYKVYLNLEEYRSQYKARKINNSIFERVIVKHKGIENKEIWANILLNKKFDETLNYTGNIIKIF